MYPKEIVLLIIIKIPKINANNVTYLASIVMREQIVTVTSVLLITFFRVKFANNVIENV